MRGHGAVGGEAQAEIQDVPLESDGYEPPAVPPVTVEPFAEGADAAGGSGIAMEGPPQASLTKITFPQKSGLWILKASMAGMEVS